MTSGLAADAVDEETAVAGPDVRHLRKVQKSIVPGAGVVGLRIQ
jgi:hypothetical protein